MQPVAPTPILPPVIPPQQPSQPPLNSQIPCTALTLSEVLTTSQTAPISVQPVVNLAAPVYNPQVPVVVPQLVPQGAVGVQGIPGSGMTAGIGTLQAGGVENAQGSVTEQAATGEVKKVLENAKHVVER